MVLPKCSSFRYRSTIAESKKLEFSSKVSLRPSSSQVLCYKAESKEKHGVYGTLCRS